MLQGMYYPSVSMLLRGIKNVGAHSVGGEEGDGPRERLLQRAEEDLDLVLVGAVRRVVEARHEHHVAT